MNKPILITGCQRSGTTLLHLILDSHPDITGIDEPVFGEIPLIEYLHNPLYHPNVSFKLPAASYQAEFIKTISGIKVLWCIRDPRDVVLSMMNLKVLIKKDAALPWVIHPEGAVREIENIAETLQKKMGDELINHYKIYKEISRKLPSLWTIEEKVYVASLCWRMKQDLLTIYEEHGITYQVVHYESLINNPENVIRGVLDFIGIPWHENVLRHHLLHSGVSVGSTVNTRPIDNSNTGKWVTTFDPKILNIIYVMCSEAAARHGYQLLDR
jgi:hypothetical protein